MPAPIVLFVYNRLHHTRRTIGALQQNLLAAESELFIFSDAAKSPEEEQKVNEVRNYIQQVNGFKQVTIVLRPKNYGLANNILDGVSSIVNDYGRIIVLEDDLVTAPWFLQYMNEALDLYKDDNRVACVHGYVYGVKENLPETFFLKGADCWGWATWKRGWALFEPDGKKLLEELERKNLRHEFDYDGAYHFTLMLNHQIKGINNSWAIRWHASAYVKDKLTLYPGRSLVQNIGNDGSGIHSGSSTEYDVALTTSPVKVSVIPVEVSKPGRAAFVHFFRSTKPGFLKWAFIKFKIAVKNVFATKS